MPSKSRPKRTPAQQKTAQQKVKNTAAQVSTSEREYRRARDQASKERKALAKQRDKELAALLKKSAAQGIYSPKSNELTPYRKRRLNALRGEWGEYLNEEKYFFIPAPKRISPEEIANLQLDAAKRKVANTKKGLFYPKNSYTSAAIKFDKKHREYYIERKGKTKQGVNKGRVYRDHIPLTSFDELTKEKGRLTQAARRLGPVDYDKGERLAFVIEEDGVEGASANLYDTEDRLLSDLDRYLKSVAARIQFYRHIRIQKTTLKEWNEKHPRRSPGAKGRKRIGKTRGKFDTRLSKG